MIKTINLKDFYSCYTQDEFAEVPDEVEAELIANRRYEKNTNAICIATRHITRLMWMMA